MFFYLFLFLSYVKDLFERKAEWALAHRPFNYIDEFKPNNYAEVIVRMLKEEILGRYYYYSLNMLQNLQN